MRGLILRDHGVWGQMWGSRSHGRFLVELFQPAAKRGVGRHQGTSHHDTCGPAERGSLLTS